MKLCFCGGRLFLWSRKIEERARDVLDYRALLSGIKVRAVSKCRNTRDVRVFFDEKHETETRCARTNVFMLLKKTVDI